MLPLLCEVSTVGSKELVETALRVLTAWTYKDLPDFSDLEILRRSCLPEEAEVPIDELACRIVARECKSVIQDSQTERRPIPSSVLRHSKKRAS
jgi:hypothetical protein